MQILVPIFICAVLPIAIVLILSLYKINGDNKRAAVIMKAIETNNNIDADKLAEALARPRKSARELINLRLLRGCIFSLAGLGLFFSGYLAWANGAEFSEDPVCVPVMLGYESAAEACAQDTADSAFRYQELYAALENIPAKERTAILLFYMEGYSVKEIAGITDASTDAVKQHLSRGRNHLRNLIKQ